MFAKSIVRLDNISMKILYRISNVISQSSTYQVIHLYFRNIFDYKPQPKPFFRLKTPTAMGVMAHSTPFFGGKFLKAERIFT